MWKLAERTVALLFLVTFSNSAYAINTITVLADKSISSTVIDIAKNYSNARDTVISASFTSPELQQSTILEGAAADILITPHRKLIDELKLQGLVDVYSDSEIARDRLVLAGPSYSPLKIDLGDRFPVARITRALDWEQGFIIGNPQYMFDGIAAKEALRNMNALEEMEPYTLYIRYPGQIMEMIKNRGAYAAVFQSTVRNQDGIKILDVFPETSYQPVIYYAVVIAGTNMDAARQFLEYLKSKEVRRTLIGSGFTVN